MGMIVYSNDRGLRRLKDGVTLEQYRLRHPTAIKVRKIPSEKTLQEWHSDGGCEAIDGCWTEPDGTCDHRYPSWLRALNWI